MEEWLISTLRDFCVRGFRKSKLVGIWVEEGSSNQQKKIASIGIRVRKGVAFHGISFNNKPILSHFEGIATCGIRNAAVTSLLNLGINISSDELDISLKKNFEKTIGK